ncbi:MAG: GAF domain-containing protein [Phycisphaerae bacterium]|nr:GAF domain-containing protein [Phycisphaerae bacterium]
MRPPATIESRPGRPDREDAYARLLASVRPDPVAEASMRRFVDVAWSLLAPLGVSWIGFYLPAARAGNDELVLGPRRDKPACSPIGLHGACGRSHLTRRGLVVTDVENLGAGYVACDPRDRSELVLPLLRADGSSAGVLDLDSFEASAFDESDARALRRALVAAGLFDGKSELPIDVV